MKVLLWLVPFATYRVNNYWPPEQICVVFSFCFDYNEVTSRHFFSEVSLTPI